MSLPETIHSSDHTVDQSAMELNGKSIPAIVLGSSLTGLGVLRSLVRSGVSTYSVCPPGEIQRKSRWYRAIPGVPDVCPGPAKLAPFLEDLKLEASVLFPCSDDWACAVARLPADVRKRFRSSIPSQKVMETMVDKWRFAQLMQELEVPTPATQLIADLGQMHALPEGCYEHAFLKPLNSQRFNARHKTKAFLIKSKTDAIEIMSRGEYAGASDFPIMLQEYIPGPPTNHYFVDGFVDRFGTVQALFARQRLRMFPRLLGNSTLMETVPVETVSGAIVSLRRLLSGSAYRGIFSAEFKLDERDGIFRILEVNARPWWFIEFAARAGVNVAAMSYRDALNLAVEPIQHYDLGRRCMYFPNDVSMFRSSRRTLGETLSWVRPIIGADETVFAWDDPRPAISMAGNALRALVRR
jgi:predicted ATP-grasp superfamily ATP-dependent carboligase